MRYVSIGSDLINTNNAQYAKRKITNSQSLSIHMIPGRGHLLVYDEAKRIKAIIGEMLVLSEKFYAENRMEKGH